jgi:hypothetical protein
MPRFYTTVAALLFSCLELAFEVFICTLLHSALSSCCGNAAVLARKHFPIFQQLSFCDEFTVLDPRTTAPNFVRVGSSKYRMGMPTRFYGAAWMQGAAQFVGNPTKIVLLKNMVGPGEVDDGLEDEVAEEVSKFGEVFRVLIFEVSGVPVAPHQAVRVQ